jgi:hypothetical protein
MYVYFAVHLWHEDKDLGYGDKTLFIPMITASINGCN